MFVPAGYVKLEGATVNRSNYSRLVALADEYSLWTSDTTANPGLFGEGDGSTTMVLPNWSGRMAQFASTAGGKVNAGVPNITGSIDMSFGRISIPGVWAGASVGVFSGASADSYDSAPSSAGRLNRSKNLFFNASRSNSIYGNATTVQPPAINVFAIMRY